MASIQQCITPAKPSKSKVRVVVRVRPFLPNEFSSVEETPLSCASVLSNNSSHITSSVEVSVLIKDQYSSRQECYKVDGFFAEEENSVAKIFDKEVKSLIPGIFDGCNATVFAYGATGSGKTFTMQGTDVQPGLMPLTMSTVLSMSQATGCIVEISYYEVYLDKCYDLLELKAKEISVLDDKEGQIHLRGLSRVPVASMSEFLDVFSRGIQRRKVAHTGLNDVSSRSHGVLVVTVSKSSDQELKANITGKLNLIDLAGNEDNRRSGNDGTRLQESAKINQSLFALSNVIYALNNNKPWVPYRETKLTRILQDSLGGTSRALMVACLNPGNYQEAVHTVSLAARSRHVSNVVPLTQKQETPKLKIDMEAKLIAWLESKGKTKSSQKKEAFGSPFLFKSPGYNSSVKKPSVSHTSQKLKSTSHRAVLKNSSMSVPPRKLFDSEVTFDSCKDNSVCVPDLEGFVDLTLSGTTQALTVLGDRKLDSELTSQDFDDVTHDCLHQFTRPESTASIPDEFLEDSKKEEIRDESFIQSPPNRPKIKACHSPLRNALSPVNINVTRLTIEEVSSRDHVHSLLTVSSAPKTPFVFPKEKQQNCDTPLDRFTACSSNLKCYLTQEYIDFLNAATREELVELKGIGVKLAEYIIELRESSPLKSLSDLEKIGLSSKQVSRMFSKAAKGIFG